MEEIKELLALEAKASKGPWVLKSVEANGYGPYWGVKDGDRGFNVVPCRVDWEGYGEGASKENADFIIAARNLTPKMARALENLEVLADTQEELAATVRRVAATYDDKTSEAYAVAISVAQIYQKTAQDIRSAFAEALND